MCVIVDNNVRDLVFRKRNDRTEANKRIFDSIDKGKLKLVVGGKLLNELKGSSQFIQWFKQANSRGLAIISANSLEVNNKENELVNDYEIESNDPHVLALAIVSNTQLLYTDDKDLEKDFLNKNIISKGKVIKPINSKKLSKEQRERLDNLTCSK